ncbi:tripartite motif-containing protein 75-like [Rhynchocyon petersi]
MAELESMLADANCPVCLDCLRDPVTIQCGHNFCRSCIQQSWEEGRRNYPCPVCREPCQDRTLRTNIQLRNTLYKAKYYQLMTAKRKTETSLCKEHNEVLNLVCQEDLQVLCPLCTKDHQGHQVKSLGEVASRHRSRLMGYIQPLMQQIAFYEKLQATEKRKTQQVSERVEGMRQKLTRDYEEVDAFLMCQDEARLSRIADAKKGIAQKIYTYKAAFSEYTSTCQRLYKEMAEKSVVDDVQLLTGIKRMYDMYENHTPPSPPAFQLRKVGFYLPPQFQPLDKIKKAFTEDVTLDPETAHPNLRVSKDKKSVTFLMTEETPVTLTYPVVLGSEAFHSGRHYWEVRVDDKPEWMVGVCAASPSRKDHPHLIGQSGYWRIQLRDGVYAAQGSVSVTLMLKEKPRGIGIYLDHEMGEISFYNLTTSSHIHAFFDEFSGILKPYFYVGSDPKPLTICAVTDDAR